MPFYLTSLMQHLLFILTIDFSVLNISVVMGNLIKFNKYSLKKENLIKKLWIPCG